MKNFRYFLPVLLYSGLIFYLSSLSNPLPIITKNVWDKLLHFIEYFIYFLLLYGGLTKFRMRFEKDKILIAFLISAIFAGSDEIHQKFVPGRTCDIYDFLTDLFSLISGAVFIFFINIKGARHKFTSFFNRF